VFVFSDKFSPWSSSSSFRVNSNLSRKLLLNDGDSGAVDNLLYKLRGPVEVFMHVLVSLLLRHVIWNFVTSYLFVAISDVEVSLCFEDDGQFKIQVRNS
jgi:hypothetical protein